MTGSHERLGLLASTLLLACSQPGVCEEVSRTLVTAPSDPVLMGGSFADVQATVRGTRSGPLRWHHTEQYVRGFPPPGQSEITVTITEPTLAWDVRTEAIRTSRYDRVSCPHYLETDLEIQLRSSDGVLDASIVVPVDIQTPDSVSLWVDVTDEDLGNLPWDPVREDARLELELAYGCLSCPEGSLRYSLEESDDAGNGVGFMDVLASFTLPNVHPERASSSK